jgi:hypothetical protein
MADFGIAHVAVRRQADRFSMRLQVQHQRFLKQLIENRGMRDKYPIPFIP